MITILRLPRIVLACVAATLLMLVPASAVWATLPNPEPAGSGVSPVTIATAPAGGGLSAWQVACIAAACVALAVLATSRLLREYRQGSGRAAHA